MRRCAPVVVHGQRPHAHDDGDENDGENSHDSPLLGGSASHAGTVDVINASTATCKVHRRINDNTDHINAAAAAVGRATVHAAAGVEVAVAANALRRPTPIRDRRTDAAPGKARSNRTQNATAVAADAIEEVARVSNASNHQDVVPLGGEVGQPECAGATLYATSCGRVSEQTLSSARRIARCPR